MRPSPYCALLPTPTLSIRPRLAEPGGDQHAQRAAARRRRGGLQRLGIAHLQVVDLEAGRVQRRLALGNRAGGDARRCAAASATSAMTRWMRRRDLALLGATGRRCASSSRGRPPRAPSAAPTISSGRSRSRTICLHDAELLVVLLAEHGDVGPDLREQLAAHRRHAAEEVRPEVALQPLGGAGRHDARGEASGYISPRSGDQTRSQPTLASLARSPASSRGIAVEVLVRGELRRVDEDRHHRAPAARLGQPHQLQVAFVQRAHGRHQGDRLARRRARR